MTTRIILPGGGGTDATITFSDITTNDVSTSKHGFAPKAPGDLSKFLNGLTGGWVGGFALIGDAAGTGSAGTLDFTSIPATFKHLLLVTKLRSDFSIATENANLRINNDSGGSSYFEETSLLVNTTTSGNPGTASAIQGLRSVGANGTAAAVGAGFVLFADYANTATHKPIILLSGTIGTEVTASSYQLATEFAIWASTSAINRVTVSVGNGGNFTTAARATLYGMG